MCWTLGLEKLFRVYCDEGKWLGFMQCLWFEKLGFNCKEGLKSEQNGCSNQIY